MRINLQGESDPEVSMSPLIDCVFLLLIFFLVGTMVKKTNKDIDVELPVSVSAVELRPDNNVIVVGVSKEGALLYEDVPTTANELHMRLGQVGLTEPDRRIRIDTDAATPFHYFVEVLDICQFRGLHNVGIRTYEESYNRR